MCSSRDNQRAGYLAVIPVNVIKPIYELVVYRLLDGANEVAISALKDSWNSPWIWVRGTKEDRVALTVTTFNRNIILSRCLQQWGQICLPACLPVVHGATVPEGQRTKGLETTVLDPSGSSEEQPCQAPGTASTQYQTT